jgi:hypothetical protein
MCYRLRWRPPLGPIVRVQFHALRERLVFVDTAQIGLAVLSLCVKI